jgi:hypothetical protein
MQQRTHQHAVKAWEEGKWVRDAAMAYAEKQESKLETSNINGRKN